MAKELKMPVDIKKSILQGQKKYILNLTPERFLYDAKSIKFSDSTYYVSYPEFIQYFQNVLELNRHNLIIGINFTYGWMPTILNLKSLEFEKPLEILNNAKKGIIPTVKELSILKGTFNNSLVGSSKLLHFINPEKFAILDSRVWYYLNGGNILDNEKICPAYLEYLSYCEFLSNHHDYNSIHESIEQKLNQKMSKFRTVELVMYTKGQKPQRSKMKKA
jgi:hypothetical protein